MPKKPTKKAKVKKVTKAKKQRDRTKGLKPKDLYDFYSDLLKNGRGSVALSATADKFRINKDEAYLLIKAHQIAKEQELTRQNEGIKDPVAKAKAKQIAEISRLKPAEEVAAHKGTTQIRVAKDQFFASTPKGFLEMRKAVFRQYVEISLGYAKPDANILVHIFLNEINEDNIMNYLTRTSREIYLGILNENLDTLANYTKA